MKAPEAAQALARAEIYLAPGDSEMEVAYHWSGFNYRNPPPDQIVEDCFRHGTRADRTLLALAETAWGHDTASFLVSSPTLESLPSGNAYEAVAKWKLAGIASSRWRSLRIVFSFVDPYLLMSLAPHRVDMFFAPLLSGPMEPEKYDVGVDAEAAIADCIQAMRPGVAELLSVLYREMVIDVEFARPSFQEDCVTLAGGDAYQMEGVVRLR